MVITTAPTPNPPEHIALTQKAQEGQVVPITHTHSDSPPQKRLIIPEIGLKGSWADGLCDDSRLLACRD